MKNLKRLAAAADFKNHPAGYLVLDVRGFEGGEFDLVPKTDGEAIYLPSLDAPGYRVAITGDNPETLKRLGNAILALARSQAGDDSAVEDDDTE